MGSIYLAAKVGVPADVAWDYLDRFTRSEVQPFSAGVAARDGEDRVVTMPGGMPARCNPITAPADCTSLDIENPKFLTHGQ